MQHSEAAIASSQTKHDPGRNFGRAPSCPLQAEIWRNDPATRLPDFLQRSLSYPAVSLNHDRSVAGLSRDCGLVLERSSITGGLGYSPQPAWARVNGASPLSSAMLDLRTGAGPNSALLPERMLHKCPGAGLSHASAFLDHQCGAQRNLHHGAGSWTQRSGPISVISMDRQAGMDARSSVSSLVGYSHAHHALGLCRPSEVSYAPNGGTLCCLQTLQTHRFQQPEGMIGPGFSPIGDATTVDHVSNTSLQDGREAGILKFVHDNVLNDLVYVKASCADLDKAREEDAKTLETSAHVEWQPSSGSWQNAAAKCSGLPTGVGGNGATAHPNLNFSAQLPQFLSSGCVFQQSSPLDAMRDRSLGFQAPNFCFSYPHSHGCDPHTHSLGLANAHMQAQMPSDHSPHPQTHTTAHAQTRHTQTQGFAQSTSAQSHATALSQMTHSASQMQNFIPNIAGTQLRAIAPLQAHTHSTCSQMGRQTQIPSIHSHSHMPAHAQRLPAHANPCVKVPQFPFPALHTFMLTPQTSHAVPWNLPGQRTLCADNTRSSKSSPLPVSSIDETKRTTLLPSIGSLDLPQTSAQTRCTPV